MEVALQNLLSPVILFFLLGMIAGLFRSCLTIPEALSKSVSLYLMMAIGFKGGVELSQSGLDTSILAAVIVATGLSALLPFIAYALLRNATGIDPTNAAAIAAHYGSVSVVTFAAAIAVLNHQGLPFEPYMVALLAVMEAPAILTGLYLARRGTRAPSSGSSSAFARGVMSEVLLHGSVVLLLGSFAIGWLTGPKGLQEMGAVFVQPFKGVLCVFLLDMGLIVARKFGDLRLVGVRVMAFGIYMPLLGGSIGLAAAALLGLSPGGATLLAVLSASASYIVVPAVMRTALPQASPAIYATLALVITFPFNLLVGIPLYTGAARALAEARGGGLALVQAAAPATATLASLAGGTMPVDPLAAPCGSGQAAR